MLDGVYRDAEFLVGLLDDPTWIERRIDSIEFLDNEQQKQRVSLLVDVVKVRERLPEGARSDLICLPLGLIEKSLLLISAWVDSGIGAASSVRDRHAVVRHARRRAARGPGRSLAR